MSNTVPSLVTGPYSGVKEKLPVVQCGCLNTFTFQTQHTVCQCQAANALLFFIWVQTYHLLNITVCCYCFSYYCSVNGELDGCWFILLWHYTFVFYYHRLISRIIKLIPLNPDIREPHLHSSRILAGSTFFQPMFWETNFCRMTRQWKMVKTKKMATHKIGLILPITRCLSSEFYILFTAAKLYYLSSSPHFTRH